MVMALMFGYPIRMEGISNSCFLDGEGMDIWLEDEFGNFGPDGEGGIYFDRGHENQQSYIDKSDPNNVTEYKQYNDYEHQLFGRYFWKWSPHCNP